MNSAGCLPPGVWIHCWATWVTWCGKVCAAGGHASAWISPSWRGPAPGGQSTQAMFSYWEINYDKFASRVLCQLPAHYVPEATLQQNVQDRDFPSRRVRKKPPQADIEEFKTTRVSPQGPLKPASPPWKHSQNYVPDVSAAPVPRKEAHQSPHQPPDPFLFPMPCTQQPEGPDHVHCATFLLSARILMATVTRDTLGNSWFVTIHVLTGMYNHDVIHLSNCQDSRHSREAVGGTIFPKD